MHSIVKKKETSVNAYVYGSLIHRYGSIPLNDEEREEVSQLSKNLCQIADQYRKYGLRISIKPDSHFECIETEAADYPFWIMVL